MRLLSGTDVQTFYLVDGHYQIFRAYYAPFSAVLSAPSGEPTKATHVFTQMVLNLIRDHKPDYLAIALDFDDAKTHRRAIYPEYKSNRDRTPEDFPPQVERIVEILGALEIPVFTVEGQEADDIIATIARKLAGEDIELRIVSRDKDLDQVLSDRVRLFDPLKGELIGPEELLAAKGYTPAQAVEIQTLTGDSTDNIPGVPGIGPKKALDLIRKYGSVAGVVEHAGELTPKMSENIRAHGDRFDLTRRLVTLDPEVELAFDLEACRTRTPGGERLHAIFEELGFRRLSEQLAAMATAAPGSAATQALAAQAGSADGMEAAAVPTDAEPSPSAPLGQPLRAELETRRVDSPAAFAEFLGELGRQTRFAIDTETTSLHPIDCDLVGLSFAWRAGEGWYLPLRSNSGGTLEIETTLERLRPILEDPRVQKYGQNIKYDINVLRGVGIELRGVAFDSMVASYLIDSTRRSHGMDALARDILRYQTISITELIGKGRKQISMLDVAPARLAEYAAEDAEVTWRLAETLRPRIESSPYAALFQEVEMPLVRVLADMEYRGVLVDPERLVETRARLSARLDELRAEIWNVAGHEFTIESPKQLAEVLFDEQGLRVVKKTKTGRSTDASVLETLALETEHPLPRLVVHYREAQKLLSSYVDPLPSLISKRTGRIHASFHQAVAATGRLSSSDPNLQNIPVRTVEGREIRRAFVPSAADRVLLTADYSQIELRVLAHLSRDPALLRAFADDVDIHRFVAAQIAGVDPADVSSDQRARAKAVNFGIIYGQGAFGLARSLGISRSEAAAFIAEYKSRYEGITRFMEECCREAETLGHVSTILGRQRAIPEIRSRNRANRALGERLAINTVVQGSAADLIKVAMVKLHERIRAERLPLEILIQVHDELVLEAPEAEVARLAEIVRDTMANAIPLEVPVRVDVAWGSNWLEGKS